MKKVNVSKIVKKLKENKDLKKNEVSFLLENAKDSDDFFTILSKFCIIEDKK